MPQPSRLMTIGAVTLPTGALGICGAAACIHLISSTRSSVNDSGRKCSSGVIDRRSSDLEDFLQLHGVRG